MAEDTQLAVIKPLSRRDRAILNEYFRNGMNATQAWITTHPGCEYLSAKAQASKWLTRLNVQEELNRRLIVSQMSADEAIKRLSDIAASDIGDVLDNNGLLDIREAKRRGLTKLLKKIKQKTVTRIGKGENDPDEEVTEIEFEMYNAHEANRDIVKIADRYGTKSRRENAANGQITASPGALLELLD